jgi:hypothetical protein
MLRLLLEHTPVKRLTRGVPVVALLSVFEVARLAGAHLKRLDAGERRRLFALVAAARRGPRALSESERSELAALVTKLEPRAFFGLAAARLSPVPVPKRLLYGQRNSRARAVASGKRS